MKRSVVSVSAGASFVVMTLTGLYAFFMGYASSNVIIHVLFGWIFVLGVVLHLVNNSRPLGNYLRKVKPWLLPFFFLVLVVASLMSFSPISEINDWYRRHKVSLPQEVPHEIMAYNFTDSLANLEVEVLAGDHFWYPQVAIWIEDSVGNYIESLMVTHSTAKGDFFGGRTKYNFKDADKGSNASNKSIIRVDALPYWSHKRGVLLSDGYFSPSRSNPLADAISGATPQGSFLLQTLFEGLDRYRILLEVNVAFDDNEYFSEFDFADDTIYHGGAGLLGQPSLIYEVEVNRRDGEKYYLMDLKGRGHHSGQTGELYQDLSGITTASEVIDRILIKVED